jgi:phosphoenolpyruvate synthase/pyruvate phosphate dikinase
MTLEENIQQLRDSLIVTSAQTLLHETRLKDHQKWQEQMESAFARMAASHEEHKREMAEIAEADAERGRKLDERIDQIAKADAERGKALDGRIDKLVSAIGELIRTRNGHN